MSIIDRVTRRAKASSARRFVVLLSDTHGGNSQGLMSPETTFIRFDEDGNEYEYTPKPTKIQSFLHKLYTYHVEQCLEVAGENNIIVIHNGDIAQGTKHIDADLMSINMMVQKPIAEENMRPWLEADQVSRLQFAEGTQAHEGVGNSMSYMVAQQLQAEYPGKKLKVVEHGLIDIDGFKIDYAHHGPSAGRRIWLKGNEARYYLRDRMTREIQAGNKPPDLYHRAHYHDPVIETLRINGYKSTLVITPSYSFPGAWTRQAIRSPNEVANGMMLLEIFEGRLLDIHEYIERTDIRTRETL